MIASPETDRSEKTFKELLEEVVFVELFPRYIDKIRFLFCLPVWTSISPFSFYWSARDLATDMFSMETHPKKQTNTTRLKCASL